MKASEVRNANKQRLAADIAALHNESAPEWYQLSEADAAEIVRLAFQGSKLPLPIVKQYEALATHVDVANDLQYMALAGEFVNKMKAPHAVPARG